MRNLPFSTNSQYQQQQQQQGPAQFYHRQSFTTPNSFPPQQQFDFRAQLEAFWREKLYSWELRSVARSTTDERWHEKEMALRAKILADFRDLLRDNFRDLFYEMMNETSPTYAAAMGGGGQGGMAGLPTQSQQSSSSGGGYCLSVGSQCGPKGSCAGLCHPPHQQQTSYASSSSNQASGENDGMPLGLDDYMAIQDADVAKLLELARDAEQQ